MSTSSPDEGTNPHHPFRDHSDKQRHRNENPPKFETLNDYHDHLSALTWSDPPKGKESDDKA